MLDHTESVNAALFRYVGPFTGKHKRLNQESQGGLVCATCIALGIEQLFSTCFGPFGFKQEEPMYGQLILPSKEKYDLGCTGDKIALGSVKETIANFIS